MNADLQSATTKQRIMKHALELFAENGFEGTSIRSLAKSADVNIAAINYHFENKENLYYSVLKNSHQEMSRSITGLAHGKEWTPQEIVPVIFDRMLEDGPHLVAVFKIFLSSSSQVYERLCSEEGFEGPPGGMEIAKAFGKIYPNASKEDLIFVVRSIFAQLIHYAVIASSLGQAAKIKVNEFKPTVDEMREDLIRVTQALSRELE